MAKKKGRVANNINHQKGEENIRGFLLRRKPHMITLYKKWEPSLFSKSCIFRVENRYSTKYITIMEHDKLDSPSYTGKCFFVSFVDFSG